MRRAAIHEAGHVLCAAKLNAFACAGVFGESSGKAGCYNVSDPVHLAAIGMAGSVGELLFANPAATLREALHWVNTSKTVSRADGELCRLDCRWAGFELAYSILSKHHVALVEIAKRLDEQNAISVIEVEECLTTAA